MYIKINLFFVALFINIQIVLSQGMSVGTASPEVSAMFEVKSTNKGLLFPRLSTSQRDSIVSPVAGLLIYNLTRSCVEFYDGSVWNPVGSQTQHSLVEFAYNVLRDSSLALNNVWTPIIQAALDSNQIVYLPYKGTPYILNDRLLIKSNTTLIIDPNAKIYLSDNLNTCFIRNKSILASTPDSNITIIGGIWDGNHNGQQNYYPSSDKVAAVPGIAGMINLMGVKRFHISNIVMRNIRGFAMHVTGCSEFTIDNINVTKPSRDAVHISGPNSKFVVRNISGETGDAFVALNAWDWSCCTPIYGNISDGVVENLTPFRSASAIVAMLPGGYNSIDNITIRNVGGEAFSQPFYIADLPDAGNPGNIIGRGQVGSIYFENIHTSCTPDTAMFYLGTRIKNLVIDNVVSERPNHPLIFQKAGYTTDYLSVSNFFSKPDSLNLREAERGYTPVMKIHGTVNSLFVNNTRVEFDTTTSNIYPFLKIFATGSVKNLFVNNHQQINGVFLQKWGNLGYSTFASTKLAPNQIIDVLNNGRTSIIDSSGNGYIYANTSNSTDQAPSSQLFIKNIDVVNNKANSRIAIGNSLTTADFIQYNGIGVDSGNSVRPDVALLRTNNSASSGLGIVTNGDIRLYTGVGFGKSFNERLRINTAGNILLGNPSLSSNGSTLQINAMSSDGSTSLAAMSISQTWNTTGTPSGVTLDISDIASNPNSKLFDFRVGGLSMASVKKDGTFSTNNSVISGGSVQFSSTGNLIFGNRGFINAQSDGVFQLTNASTVSFNRLIWGSATSSYPSLKRNLNELKAVLGDDSGFTFVEDLYRRKGEGSPEGVVTAPVGAVYHRTDGSSGTSFYVKESGNGNIGWVAK